MEELKNIVTNLASECTCPVCLNALYSPVSVCLRGHAVCGSCRSNLDMCPLCQECYPQSLTSTLLNLVVELIPRMCKFEGCQEFVKPGANHEKWCGFQPAACTNCEWTGHGRNLLDHFETEHATCFKKEEIGWQFEQTRYYCYNLAFESHGHMFLMSMNECVDNCLKITYSHVPNGLEITKKMQLSLILGDKCELYVSSMISLTPDDWLNNKNNSMFFAIPSLEVLIAKEIFECDLNIKKTV